MLIFPQNQPLVIAQSKRFLLVLYGSIPAVRQCDQAVVSIVMFANPSVVQLLAFRLGRLVPVARQLTSDRNLAL